MLSPSSQADSFTVLSRGCFPLDQSRSPYLALSQMGKLIFPLFPWKVPSSQDITLGHFCPPAWWSFLRRDLPISGVLPHARQPTAELVGGKELAYSASAVPVCISFPQFWIRVHWNPCWKHCLPVEDTRAYFDIFSDKTTDKYRQGEALSLIHVKSLYFSQLLKMLWVEEWGEGQQRPHDSLCQHQRTCVDKCSGSQAHYSLHCAIAKHTSVACCHGMSTSLAITGQSFLF